MTEYLDDYNIRNDGEDVAAWLREGHDVNLRDRFGETLLHKAVDAYNLEAVRLLLAAGADPNARDAWGQTPLHRAVDSEVQLLIYEGLDESGDTAVKLLLRGGAHCDLADRDGNTAVDWAREQGHRNAVQMFEALSTQLP